MRGHQSYLFSNISSADDQTVFELVGGAYSFDAVATFGGGSVTLERLGPDQATWIIVAARTAAPDGTEEALALPPGRYRLTVVTATAVYASVTRIPGD